MKHNLRLKPFSSTNPSQISGYGPNKTSFKPSSGIQHLGVTTKDFEKYPCQYYGKDLLDASLDYIPRQFSAIMWHSNLFFTFIGAK